MTRLACTGRPSHVPAVAPWALGVLRFAAVVLLSLGASVVRAEDELATVLQSAMAGTDTPALAVLTLRDGAVDQQAVRGVRRNDRPDAATLDDAWLIGSTGKVMTVAAIARLVERGALAWDTPLSQLLPELAESMHSDYRDATLVHLLSHRAGLPENLQDGALLDRFYVDQRPLPEQRRAYVAAALAEAPVQPPGSGFAYSNSGFLIAAVIAERATGENFETLLQRGVFDPLGMASAGFGAAGDSAPQGHRDGHPVGAPTRSADGVPAMFTPAGNLHMTLGDWAKFALDQLAGSRGQGRLLTTASYRLMQTAQPGSPAGLDWGVQASIAGRRGPVLAHGGSDGNSLAWIALFPESNTGVLVVANAAPEMGAEQATHALLGAVFARLSPPK
jgi:CubicO group peptidase (beta-lactamase class C family)